MTLLVEEPHNESRRQMFRDGFLNLLSTIKADVELGEKFIPKFTRDYEIDDCTIGLGEAFKLSGLDINAPGHWQLLLVGILNEYASPPTRPTIKWRKENERLFLRRMIDQRLQEPNKDILGLCESLKGKHKEYIASENTLRAQFQKTLREMRERTGDSDGYPAKAEEVALLKEFDELRGP